MDAIRVWYWISSVLLAALLFSPVKKFIYVQKVRKAERKLKRELSEEERKELEKKSIPVTAIIVLFFSFLFNSVIIGKYYMSK